MIGAQSTSCTIKKMEKQIYERKQRAEIALQIYQILHGEFMRTKDVPTMDFIRA